jgi:hypothetical protein
MLQLLQTMGTRPPASSIIAAAELTDLLEAFEDIKVKKPHRRLVLTAFDALRGGAS